MKAFFFGESKAALYGVYHPAGGQVQRDYGVVLCYPFGQEYMRSHRAFRQIATQLSKKGFHVLRFDYRGTGDSSGNMEDMLASNCLEDIDTAIEELKSMTDLKAVSLMGLRMGAIFASASANRREDIKKLAVWDPMLSGEDCENELLLEIDKDDVEPWNFMDDEETLHFNGFPLTKAFRSSLKEIDIVSQLPEVEQFLQVVSHETASFDRLKNTWGNTKAELTYVYSESPSDWNYVDDFGGILLPQPVIQTLVSWFANEGDV